VLSGAESFAQHQQAFGPHLDETEIVDAAKQRWKRCFFVGVTERMNEAVALLFARFGWQPPAQNPRLTSRKKKEFSVSPKIAALLDEYTQLDRLVYDHAVQLFETNRLRFHRYSSLSQKHPAVDIVQIFIGCTRFRRICVATGFGFLKLNENLARSPSVPKNTRRGSSDGGIDP